MLSQLGEDFHASLYLGRLALEAGDLPGALREMSAARRHSPARFARMRAEIWRGIADPGTSQSGDVAQSGEWTEAAGAGGFLKSRRKSAADRSLPSAHRPRRSGMAASGSMGFEGQERDHKSRRPQPPIHYWELTPESFDLGIDAGQEPGFPLQPTNPDERGPQEGPENEEVSGFSGSWLFKSEFMSSGGNGRSPSEADAGDEDRARDEHLTDDEFLQEESHEESPWMDFLSHPYLFNSLPMGEPEDELDGFEALADDPFEFLTDEESEALSPWSDPFAAEDFQPEETPDFGSPLAGFYADLEEARRQAEGEPDSGSEGLTDFGSQGVQDSSDDPSDGPSDLPSDLPSDRERFEGLPPIQQAELEAVDWQDLLDRLGRS